MQHMCVLIVEIVQSSSMSLMNHMSGAGLEQGLAVQSNTVENVIEVICKCRVSLYAYENIHGNICKEDSTNQVESSYKCEICLLLQYLLWHPLRRRLCVSGCHTLFRLRRRRSDGEIS